MNTLLNLVADNFASHGIHTQRFSEAALPFFYWSDFSRGHRTGRVPSRVALVVTPGFDEERVGSSRGMGTK